MLTPITLEWDVTNPDGTQGSGALLFQLSQLVDGIYVPVSITDSTSGETVEPVVIAGNLYFGQLLSTQPGQPPQTLIANDDSTTTPVGTVYLVTEKLAAGSLDPWPLTVPHTAPGGVLNISSQRPTP